MMLRRLLPFTDQVEVHLLGSGLPSPETSEVFQSLLVWEVMKLEILRCFAVFEK
jgi:hypothetical protein